MNSFKEFQLSTAPISEKSKEEYGRLIGDYIEQTFGGMGGNYYSLRNARYLKNRNFANGRIDVQSMFQDRLDFDGKINYTNLNWKSIHICNRIISGIVGRWMGRNEKINVTAIDSISVTEKIGSFKTLEFYLHNKKVLAELSQESGVNLLPATGIPEDEEELYLWQTQYNRTPEEILFETGCNDVLQQNGFFSAIKEKLLHDSCETGFVGTYTWMDEDGVIHVEWVKPENAIYSASEYPDFRDTTWRGEIKSLKISEIRRKYGKEFGGKLSEEDIFQMAGTSKEYQRYDKLTWIYEWVTAFTRPYDEWNVDVIYYEVKSVDSDSYIVTETKKNKSTIIQRAKTDSKIKETKKSITDTHWNIYKGVYIRGSKILLEWGVKKNMIRPQDPKEIGNAEFSYSFYMYQNYGMRNLAIPEKIEEPIEQMILARLKIQQVIAKMVPVGAAINWDALQEIDYGLGEDNKTINPQKHYEQTGKLYYRGRDAEGNPIPVPIIELANTGFIGQMQGLMQVYNFHYQVLKDELGEDPNLSSQALQPRVTTGNINTAQRVSEEATGYMYAAYLYVIEDTARKISCLLHDSVQYGSKVYRRMLSQEDIDNRIFTTKIEMLPEDYQIAKLEMFLNNAMASNPNFVMYADPFKIMRVAKENITLAEQLIRQAQKKMYSGEQQKIQQTIQGQIASAQEAEKSKQETKRIEGDIEIQKANISGDTQNKNTILASIMKMYESGTPIPEELKPLANAIIENVALPVAINNTQQKQEIGQAMANETIDEGQPSPYEQQSTEENQNEDELVNEEQNIQQQKNA